MAGRSTREERLIVGEIRKPHGIKGECYVMPATDDVAGVYAKGRELLLGDPAGRPHLPETRVRIEGARGFKGGLLVRFAGIADRNAVEPLRGRTLLIRREEVRPLEAGEFFLHDLQGLEVRTVEGDRVGTVVEVYGGAATHYLGVDDGTREHLIPFNQHVVRKVDLEGSLIVIDPPPGLLTL